MPEHKWGRLAALSAVALDAWSVCIYLVDPWEAFGERPLAGFEGRWRSVVLRPELWLFDGVVGLAAVRVVFYVVFVGSTPTGAALSRDALARWHLGFAVLVVAAAGSVAYRLAAGRVGVRRGACGVALCCVGLVSLELWRAAWDYLRYRAPAERDVFVYASEQLRRLLAFDLGGGGGEALLPRREGEELDDAASQRLARRLRKRGESIREFWADVVDRAAKGRFEFAST